MLLVGIFRQNRVNQNYPGPLVGASRRPGQKRRGFKKKYVSAKLLGVVLAAVFTLSSPLAADYRLEDEGCLIEIIRIREYSPSNPDKGGGKP